MNELRELIKQAARQQRFYKQAAQPVPTQQKAPPRQPEVDVSGKGATMMAFPEKKEVSVSPAPKPMPKQSSWTKQAAGFTSAGAKLFNALQSGAGNTAVQWAARNPYAASAVGGAAAGALVSPFNDQSMLTNMAIGAGAGLGARGAARLAMGRGGRMATDTLNRFVGGAGTPGVMTRAQNARLTTAMNTMAGDQGAKWMRRAAIGGTAGAVGAGALGYGLMGQKRQPTWRDRMGF